jgi:hypothetical protein
VLYLSTQQHLISVCSVAWTHPHPLLCITFAAAVIAHALPLCSVLVLISQLVVIDVLLIDDVFFSLFRRAVRSTPNPALIKQLKRFRVAVRLYY